MWQSHQKRKTNHEPNEEDRNKLAIGYRLSAIGYRLSAIGYRLSAIGYRLFLTIQIVFSLVLSVWSLNVAAQTTSKQYASNEQIFEEAEKGDLQAMNLVGNIYKNGSLNRPKSNVEAMRWFQKAADGGYGPALFNVGLLYEKGGDGISINFSKAAKYYMQAVDAGFKGKAIERLNIVCENSSKDIKAVDCQKFGKYQAQERREAADRVANACNNFYQGKSIGFKPAGFSYFGSVLDAVVLGKGNGNVSIKIVDRHFTDLYGKTLEMSCTSDQLQ